MPLKHVEVNNIYDLLSVISKEENVNKIFLLFTGSKNECNKSWCPDCVTAEPIVKSCLSNFEDKSKDSNTMFITVYVGTRPEWKDPKNHFRVNPKLQVKCVPTLLQYGTASLTALN